MKARITSYITIASFLFALLPAGAGAVSVQSRTAPGNTLYMLNESGQFGYRGPFFVGIDYNVLNDPLVELDFDEQDRRQTILDGLQTFDLTAAFNVASLFSLNATVPLNIVHPDGQGRSWAAGDARLFAKVPLTDRASSFQFSLVPELRLPTGDEGLFVSDGSVSFGMLLAAEQRFRSFSIVGNLGYRRSPDALFRELDYRNRVPYAVGVSVPLGSRWNVAGEFAGSRVLPFNGSQNPSEIYAGARYQAAESVALLGGGSFSTFSTEPSANYRFMIGLKIEPLPSADPVGTPRAWSSQLGQGRGMERGEEAGSSEALAAGEGHEAPPMTDEVPVPQAAAVPAPEVVLGPDRIETAEDIRFAHDSAELTPASKRLLDQVASVIAANPERIGDVEVEGHTNELGPARYNLTLSQRRADAVAEYLAAKTARIGHPAELRATGYGEEKPKAGSERLRRHARLEVNRRVEFKFAPPEPQSAGQAGE